MDLNRLPSVLRMGCLPWVGGKGNTEWDELMHEGLQIPEPGGLPRRSRGRGQPVRPCILSAEHSEFTWNQKAWEDKLIQVKGQTVC